MLSKLLKIFYFNFKCKIVGNLTYVKLVFSWKLKKLSLRFLADLGECTATTGRKVPELFEAAVRILDKMQQHDPAILREWWRFLL